MIATTLLAMALIKPPKVSEVVAQSWKQTLVIGHRGAAAYKPENTLPAFEAAIESKAVGAETDVHISRDGVPMIMHDGSLDRTTSLKGAIKDTDSATMIAAGVPTLTDYFGVTKDRIVSVVEIKDGQDVVKKVIDEIHRLKLSNQVILFSFNADYIAEAKKRDRHIFAAWLNSNPTPMDKFFDKVKEIHADAIAMAWPVVNEKLVEEAHQRKLPVFAWTVDPGKEVDRLKGLKVNFIITNSPRDVREQLER